MPEHEQIAGPSPATGWPVGEGEMAARIRAHDWAAIQLGPLAAWPPSLRTVVELMLAAPQPVYIAWGPENTSLYNDGYLPILGGKHPDALGRPYAEVFAEIWAEYRPIVAAVLAGESRFFEDQPVPLAGRPGRPMSWFTFSWTPLRDESGAVVGFFCMATETTEKVRAEADLRASEERFQLAAAAVDAIIYDWDLTTGRVVRPRGVAEVLGYADAEAGALADDWLRFIHPDDRARVDAEGRAALAGGGDRYTLEYRIRHQDGTYRDFWDHGRIIRDDQGRAVRVVGNSVDITGRKRAEMALRASETRQAFLLRLSDALRPLEDPVEIIGTATRLLGEGLGASRAYYAEWPPGTDYVEIRRDYVAPGLPSLVGRYPIEFFRSTDERFREGRTWVVEDAADGTIPAAERDYCLAHGVVAWVDVPLVKGGQLQAALFLVQGAPRCWSATEIALAEETAERTWAAVERARAEDALRASEARFRAFGAASSDLLWIRDAATLHLEYLSPAFAALYGADPADLAGGDPARWAALIHPEDRETALANLGRVRGGARVAQEFRIVRPADGEVRWMRDTAFPIRDEAGTVRAVGGIAQDITADRRAEAALRASEERFRGFAENSSDTLWIIDADTGQLDYLSPAFERMWGEQRAVVLGDLGRWTALVHPDDRATAAIALPRALAGETCIVEYRIIRPSDGATRWIRDTGFPIRDDAGTVRRAAGIAQDITDHIEAETALRETLETLEARVTERTATLRALSRQLLGVREAEQRHLSRELHDQIGQLLTGLRLALATGSPDADTLDRAHALADDIQARVRALSLDLRPPALDDLGLLPALRDHLRRYAEQTGVRPELRQAGLDRRLPPAVETAAFRIVQEALTNVARHAGTAATTVQLVADDGWLTVQVRDEGRGFDPDAALAARASAGLMGMRERATLLDGTLTIDAAPGAGTVVTAELPVSELA